MTFVKFARYHSSHGYPSTPWDNHLFSQKGDVVRSSEGFTHFTLVEWPNDGFNLTANVPTLVVGCVPDALTELADPKYIIDAVDPAAANVEEIRTWRSTPLRSQLS